jgi:hypothetical protein
MADYSFFIKDSGGEIGYAEIYQNEEGLCVSSLFQNRIDLKKRYEDAIEEIYEGSKCYLKEDHSLLDSINSILDFWLMPSIGLQSCQHFPRFDCKLSHIVPLLVFSYLFSPFPSTLLSYNSAIIPY